MVTLTQAMKYMRELTFSEANKIFPKHVSLSVKFDRDIKEESDGFMRPIYCPDGKIKFNIVYNLDLLEANLKNLKGNAVKGLVKHELSHIYDALYNPSGFAKSPHKNKTFTTMLMKLSKAKKGSPEYKALMQPDVSTECALKQCKNKIAPAWLSNYWLYACKKCGYYDAYITDLRAKKPVCEKCGNHDIIMVKLPIAIAAKMDQMVTRNPKGYDTDKEMRGFILRTMFNHANPNQRLILNNLIKRKIIKR